MSTQGSSPFAILAARGGNRPEDMQEVAVSAKKPLVSEKGHVSLSYLTNTDRLNAALKQKPESVPALTVVGKPYGQSGSSRIPLARIWSVEAVKNGEDLEERVQFSGLKNRVLYMQSIGDKVNNLGPAALVHAPEAAKVTFRRYNKSTFGPNGQPDLTPQRIIETAPPLAILAPLTWEPTK